MEQILEKIAFGQGAARSDIAIIGGGIVGLSIGWRLARRGLSVTIFERDVYACGATHAATGMLAAATEVEPGEDDLLPLTLESQRLWPDFARLLEEESGETIDYRSEGTLVVALSRDEVDRLRFRHELQTRLGLNTVWLSGSAAREREPGLRPTVAGAIFTEGDHQVDPRRVARALAKAFRKAGGILREHLPVEALERSGGRVTGVITAEGVHHADTVIVCSGAWSGQMELAPGLKLPVRPLKGQSLALRMDPRMPALTHIVWTEQIHLAPKGDGRLIVGASVEEKGFDTQNTAGALLALLDAAHRVLPSMEELAIDEFWTGFRPTSTDDAPIFGEVGVDGLLVATGHHRNGILLAPVTARALENLVTEGRFDDPEAAFTLQRFGRNTTSAQGF